VTDLPPLRYLSAAEVVAAMPALPERLVLAERTLRGLADGAQLPPKIVVHPRPPGSFGHAMPAFLPGNAADAGEDLLGMKWVLGFGTNAPQGLPAIHGLLLLNDPVTGVPTAILDAGPITAERTAAVSGVAIRAFAPAVSGRAPRAALIGAGAQGHSHLPVLAFAMPGVEISIFDRDPDRATALAEVARSIEGIGAAQVAPSAHDAVDGTDVVVTVASFVPPPERQVMTRGWLTPDALVVPVDYATYCSAEVARDAALFLVDHRQQFLANRDAGNFDGFPDPTAMLGEIPANVGSGWRRPAGRIVAMHLGTGLADVVFGAAILAGAVERGLGTLLPR
jgi:ornithine cyclodeaminase/alanine dehydrogenase-like protein (mu-crystallin family)